MAVLKNPAINQVLEDSWTIGVFLAAAGIDYSHTEKVKHIPDDATDQEILDAYAAEIEELKAKGSYVTADVINVVATTPGLEEMLAKFSREHWHDEDEVRFIVRGRGLFHIAPAEGGVFSLEVGPGDMIRVPRGTRHWFNLCGDRTIRAIRLFRDVSGWTPHYTGSGVDGNFEPVCFGASYFPEAR